jgi:hypothetical protein
MASEHAVDQGIRDKLKARGGWSVKTTGVAAAGVPDRIGHYRGIALFIEVKNSNGTGRLSPLQLATLRKIHVSGGVALVMDDAHQVEDVCDRIDHILDGERWRMTTLLPTISNLGRYGSLT